MLFLKPENYFPQLYEVNIFLYYPTTPIISQIADFRKACKCVGFFKKDTFHAAFLIHFSSKVFNIINIIKNKRKKIKDTSISCILKISQWTDFVF